MAEALRKSWLRQRIEGALVKGLTQAYETVKVDPAKFLIQMRAAYDLPISTFQGVYSVDINRLDEVAESIIRGSMKLAAAEEKFVIVVFGEALHFLSFKDREVLAEPRGASDAARGYSMIARDHDYSNACLVTRCNGLCHV